MERINEFYVYENTDEKRKEFKGFGWVDEEVEITYKELGLIVEALISGKCVSLFDGEYTKQIYLKNVVKK